MDCGDGAPAPLSSWLVFLLDTNVVSELRRPNPHGAVVAWVRRQPNEQLHLSSVTLGELQAGAERTREQDSAKAAELDLWIDRAGQMWSVHAMDGPAFRLWARLLHRRSDTLVEDAMIAATALVHGLTVATRNVRDFVPFGVETVNPFSATPGSG